MTTLKFKPAVRKAVPLITAVSGPSGSGKTLSSILYAAGLAGPGGWVRLADSENERGLFYADDPLIVEALPQGFEHVDLTAPFSPARYIEVIDSAEKAGVDVLVIDSGSHEWEGPGGCHSIAAADKGRWNRAKLENRRYVYRLIYSSVHIVVCLRAQEKTKIIPKDKSASGKEEVISLGMLPICEKNFMYEMLVSLMLDESTHSVIPVKVPSPLRSIFKAGELLAKATGEAMREWNNGGSKSSPIERLQRRAAAAASVGLDEYTKFFEGLTAKLQTALTNTTHEENRRIAARADQEAADAAALEEAEFDGKARNQKVRDLGAVERLPDPMEHPSGTRATWKGGAYVVEVGEEGPKWKASPISNAA